MRGQPESERFEMDSMVLCLVCQRHIFAHETHCPFCASARAPGALEAGRASGVDSAGGPGISRAQAYAAGIALATGVAAGCGGSEVPIALPPPEPTVNTQSGGKVMMVAGPAEGGDGNQLAGDGNSNVDQQERERQLQRQKELEEQENWMNRRRRSNPCVTDPKTGRVLCPPYGCVFPDEACDVLRV